MTYNQGLGGGERLFTADSPAAFNAALLVLLEQISASRLPDRIRQQAEEIAEQEPDLVGLQEVWNISCVDAVHSDREGCENPRIAGAFNNHLAETLDALDAFGGNYDVIAEVSHATFPPVPFQIEGASAVLTAVDGEVILAHTGTAGDALPVNFGCASASGDGCNFLFAPAIPTPVGELRLRFGFVGVDATVGGRAYRFVTTHLSPKSFPPEFQCVQAAELIQTLQVPTPDERALIVVGDFNSSPVDQAVVATLPVPAPCAPIVVPPYQLFTEAGYTDVWTLPPGRAPGYTCCQAATLDNVRSLLSVRFDLIFSEVPPTAVTRALVVGASMRDKIRPPGQKLWPSDHAGVAAGLQLSGTVADAADSTAP
jgi:hypothetical protein